MTSSDDTYLWDLLLVADVLAARKIHRNVTTGCWEWLGCLSNGYGRMSRNGRPLLAHRYLYQLLRGQIPDGLHLDHLCRVPRCVNPEHLEPVTPLENTRRGEGNGKETHCPQGHPYAGENLRFGAGRRYCRTCQCAASRQHREKVTLSTPAEHPWSLILQNRKRPEVIVALAAGETVVEATGWERRAAAHQLRREGLKYREIAERMNVSLDWVRSQLRSKVGSRV